MDQPWIEKYRPKQVHIPCHPQPLAYTNRRKPTNHSPTPTHRTNGKSPSHPTRRSSFTHPFQHRDRLERERPPVFYASHEPCSGTLTRTPSSNSMLPTTGFHRLSRINTSGIDVVREKIKMFAQKKVSLPEGFHKIVLLDEADSMTPAAQQALRRIMELYSSTTRFALACNISSKIIEPIQVRQWIGVNGRVGVRFCGTVV